jgi:hypothetical protein
LWKITEKCNVEIYNVCILHRVIFLWGLNGDEVDGLCNMHVENEKFKKKSGK